MFALVSESVGCRLGLVQPDLYELGLTSHASVNVMLALEDEFDIEFPDEVLKKSTFASVRNIEQVVEGLVKSSA
jgi:acyl carrier protein